MEYYNNKKEMKENTMENKILITIDRHVMKEYMDYYFAKSKGCKTFPFAKRKTEKKFKSDGSPDLTDCGNQRTKKVSLKKNEITEEDLIYSILSLNEVLIIPDRIQMNSVKEKWGQFGKWLSEKYEISGKQFSNAVVEIKVYSEVDRNKDLDNLGGGFKFLGDGLFVESKSFVDDNFKHICPLIISAEIDKKNPRTEIRISVIDDNIKDIYEKTQIHINNWK